MCILKYISYACSCHYSTIFHPCARCPPTLRSTPNFNCSSLSQEHEQLPWSCIAHAHRSLPGDIFKRSLLRDGEHKSRSRSRSLPRYKEQGNFVRVADKVTVENERRKEMAERVMVEAEREMRRLAREEREIGKRVIFVGALSVVMWTFLLVVLIRQWLCLDDEYPEI